MRGARATPGVCGAGACRPQLFCKYHCAKSRQPWGLVKGRDETRLPRKGCQGANTTDMGRSKLPLSPTLEGPEIVEP